MYEFESSDDDDQFDFFEKIPPLIPPEPIEKEIKS
jgi:hypothetical protein